MDADQGGRAVGADGKFSKHVRETGKKGDTMNRIIEAAENKADILKWDNEVRCPLCDEKLFSPFDKLYTYSYGKCVNCSTSEEIMTLSENIFAIL